DYALHGPINPSLLVVTDTNKPKLSYARRHYPSEPQTLIHYLDGHEASRDTLLALSGGHGFDDIFVFVPNEQLITLASSLLAPDGCLNFFAGPQDKQFSAPINFYDVHYAFTHYVGTSGGNTDDMRAAVALMQAKKVQTAKVVTHILGLNAAGETTLDLPAVGGGKKLVYTGKAFPLTPLGEIADPELAAIVARHHGIWSQEAEAYLLAHAEDITHD
ncbi:L-sorbose 1-phosphate reductase, partial [Klebsiella pneumoniae]